MTYNHYPGRAVDELEAAKDYFLIVAEESTSRAMRRTARIEVIHLSDAIDQTHLDPQWGFDAWLRRERS